MLDSDTGLLDIQMLDSDTGLLDSDIHKCSTAYTGGVVLGSEPERPGRDGRAESESLRVSRCAWISGLPGTGTALGV